MNVFEESYVGLIATIGEDVVMTPIKQMGPVALTRKALEKIDSLIDEPIERHSDLEFTRRLVMSSMLSANEDTK
ncbi:hypothetical protein IFT48_04415 [Pseudomonas fluorescens]|uniref:hypothetical protein n=1 Tax=Pseudomonas TaxID=286 RepID=UPI000F0141E8|nr:MULTISPECIES: hypothetical protein [Pseudomonas]MBD8089216.1 hypothetical protein [Pseudomonas fluorescens]MBD8615357.1 hypothetical protein [Pseudomonas putida]MBD8681989.1 hypothetical protein [Pseudomonas sp. CFBP 13719]